MRGEVKGEVKGEAAWLDPWRTWLDPGGFPLSTSRFTSPSSAFTHMDYFYVLLKLRHTHNHRLNPVRSFIVTKEEFHDPESRFRAPVRR